MRRILRRPRLQTFVFPRKTLVVLDPTRGVDYASAQDIVDPPTLTAGDLTAVVGDNRADGDHRAGYNGIWSLRHRLADRSLIVPGTAGPNLEHIITGVPLRSPDDTSVELHQPPTPVTRVESTTRFRLQAPNFLDMIFECCPRKPVFPHRYLTLFWASYIHAPTDKSIYFLGGLEGHPSAWTQFCPQFHNDQSTVRHRNDDDRTEWEPDELDTLFRNFSNRDPQPAGRWWLRLFRPHHPLPALRPQSDSRHGLRMAEATPVRSRAGAAA